MDDLIVKVEGVSKEYRLGAIGGTTLKDEIQRLFAKIRRKEDPTAVIGQERMSKGGKFMALSDISFEARKGEAVGIIGHNGAGKSTLLKLITRVTAPSSGAIYLNGRVASMLEVGTGFHPELTGRENIYVNGAILGMTKKEIDSKMEQIIEFSECRQFIDTPVKRYSSGMYVKLAFSVAAHLDSEILIMDEVLAVGDVAFQNKCIQKMKSVAQSGRTIFYVSHNMSTIRALCNRCIVLNKGKIDYIGDVEESIQHYVKATFDLATTRELSNLKRPYTYLVAHEAHLEKIEALDKDRCLYYMGEKMPFELSWSAKRKFERMNLRVGVWSANGNPVGISYSESFSGDDKQLNKTRFELDISKLLPGKYNLELILTELDEQGAFGKQDVLNEVICFEVIVPEDKPVYNGCNSSWGNLEFDTKVIL